MPAMRKPRLFCTAGTGGDGMGFGIYIHWPFCLSKCPYCDFNSHVAERVAAKEWCAAYLNALARFAERTPGRVVTSVFFGGGTPSLMPPELVAAIIDAIAGHWSLADDAEITLEANPSSAERAKFAAFAAAGVNRLSLGVQALDDEALQSLGRRHTAAEAITAFDWARKVFARASFDLIYARPGQTPAQWEAELERALALRPEHLSCYQLSMEPETPFHALHRRGRLVLPDEEISRALYRLTTERLTAAGLAPYEVSNYARAGARCRHNLLYWRYGEYAGVGPGAHSRLIGPGGGRLALVCERSPRRWLTAALAGGAGLAAQERLTGEQVALEYLLMSLRTSEGADLSRLRLLSGLAPESALVEELERAGLLRREGERIVTTSQGRLVLEAIITELAAALKPVDEPA